MCLCVACGAHVDLPNLEIQCGDVLCTKESYCRWCMEYEEAMLEHEETMCESNTHTDVEKEQVMSDE